METCGPGKGRRVGGHFGGSQPAGFPCLVAASAQFCEDRSLTRQRACRLGFVVALTTLAGCGSAGTPTTPSTTTPPSATAAPAKAAFIAEADTICANARAKLRVQQAAINAALKAEQANDTATNRHVLGDALNQDSLVASPLLDQLRGLQPPAADRVVIAKYESGVASQIGLIQQFANAIDSNDAQAVRTIVQQLQLGKASVQGLAQGYGFKVCGSGA